MYTVIYASEEQQKSLLERHLKDPIIPWILKLFGTTSNAIKSKKFAYDDEDDIGFVTLKLLSGIRCSYQLRSSEPCFVEFTGFQSSIRYDISYPKGEMYDILKKAGCEARDNFWKGGEI